MKQPRVRVEPLDAARHRLREFSCGNDVLDRWLHAYAGQAQRRDVARTYVAVDDRGQVAGYYTLVAGQVEHTASEGDGPVNALDAALRKGLVRFFPRLTEMQLVFACAAARM